MPDLETLLNSKELKERSRLAAKRRLEKDTSTKKSYEEYVDFLEEINKFKRELNAPKLPHPKMKGEKFAI